MKHPAGRQGNWLAIGVLLLGAIYIVAGVGLLFPAPRQVILGLLETPTATLAPTRVAAAVPTWTPVPILVLSPTPISLPTLAMLPLWTLSPKPISLPTLPMLPTLALSPTPISSATPAKLSAAIGTPEPALTATAQPHDLRQGAAFSLTIVHTNDTWGYTRPCG